jgi:single-strand DNA-binding protein
MAHLVFQSGFQSLVFAAAGCDTVQDKMAKSVNKVILLGNLGKDAETRFTTGGISISKFSLATGRNQKDPQTGEWKEITDWHNVVVWKTEHVSNFLLKGKQVYLEGRIENRSYEKDGQKRYITEVICDAASLVLLGGGARDSGGDSDRVVSMPRPPARPQQSAPPEEMSQGIAEDDVPF